MRWESGGWKELGRWERDGLCIGGRGVADLTAPVILIFKGGGFWSETLTCKGQLQLRLGQCSKFRASESNKNVCSGNVLTLRKARKTRWARTGPGYGLFTAQFHARAISCVHSTQEPPIDGYTLARLIPSMRS